MTRRGDRTSDRRLAEIRARLLAGLPVSAHGVEGRAGRALALAQAAGAPAVPALDAAASAAGAETSRARLLEAASAQARAVFLGMAAIPVLALPALGSVLGRPLWPFYLTPAGVAVGLVGGGLVALGLAVGRLLVRRAGRTGPGHDEVADLVAVALAGGVPAVSALRLVAEHRPSDAALLRRAAAGLELGRPSDVPGDLGRVMATLDLSTRYGTPAAPALRRVADDLRADELARVRAAAERLPAQLAFPTALCHLPGTLLLVGAPLLATGLAAAGAGGT